VLRRTAGLIGVVLAAWAAPVLADWQKEVLNVNLPGEPATLDPHLQWDTDSYKVYRNIFDNLISRDPAGEIVPQIATSWTYLSPTEIEFTIQGGVTFHDGSPLGPEDVAFSVNRIIDPELRSPQLSQFNSIVEATVSGPDKVLVRTETAYPVLLAQLVKLSIVPKTYVESVSAEEFNQRPIGSGPYRFADWQRGVAVTLEANEGYWRGKPPFGRVVFSAVPDGATRIANLRTGRADLIRALTPDDAIALAGESGVQVLPTPTERVAYMFINALAGPTADLRVRRAIAHAIDRQLLVDALMGGYAQPTNIVLTPVSVGYVEGIPAYPFDLDRARELVREAGAEGAELVFLTSPAYDARVVQALQQMVQETGLVVNLAFSDQPTFLRRRQGPAEDAGSLSIGNWSCACQDADGVIFPLFRSGSIWSKYNNPEFDAAVDAAREVLDEAERLEHYRRAFEILYEDVPGLGLYQVYAIYAARSNLVWQPTPNEAFFVFEMGWKS